MPKRVQRMTPERIRTEFIEPLAELVSDFVHTTARFQDAIRSGRVERPYIEMNIEMAKGAIAQLQSFYQKEFADKVRQIVEGTYRWRYPRLPTRNDTSSSAAGPTDPLRGRDRPVSVNDRATPFAGAVLPRRCSCAV